MKWRVLPNIALPVTTLLYRKWPYLKFCSVRISRYSDDIAQLEILQEIDFLHQRRKRWGRRRLREELGEEEGGGGEEGVRNGREGRKWEEEG